MDSGKRKLSMVVWMMVILLFLSGFSVPCVAETRTYPPLVPEGQIVPDKESLVVNSSSPVLSVAFSPDGKILASGSDDNFVQLWDVATGKPTAVLRGHTRPVNSVCFSPDRITLASGSLDSTVRLWDAATGKEIQTLRGHTDYVSSVCFSPDGKTLASGSGDRTLRLWDVATGKEMKTLRGHNYGVSSVCFSPDGNTLASGSYDETARVRAAATGKPTAVLRGHTSRVNSVCFSPDSKTLASGSEDKTVRLWDVATGKEAKRLLGHTSNVSSVCFSRDGKTLASGSLDQNVRLWDVATGKEMKSFLGHTGSVFSVCFNPDGKILASGSLDRTVRLWDVASGKVMKTLRGHTDWVYSVCFSRDGNTLASGSADRTLRLWDVATGKTTKTLLGHIDSVFSVCFNRDGKTLSSGSGDGTVQLQDVDAENEMIRLRGHTGSVSSVCFSPDGKTLASGSYDGTVRLWDASQTSVPLIRTCYSGWNGQWVSIDYSEKRMDRYDDGSLLMREDENGLLSPILPPMPEQKGLLEVKRKQPSLITKDGDTTDFSLEISNTGQGCLYWINILQDRELDKPNPLNFFPPDTVIVLEPGQMQAILCKVSALSDYTNPLGQKATLHLKITALYDSQKEPILLDIPVEQQTPSLEYKSGRIDKQDKRLILATFLNIGKQSLPKDTEINAIIDGKQLNKVTIAEVGAGQSVDVPFVIPDGIKLNKNTRVSFYISTTTFPIHSWEFDKVTLTFPLSGWFLFLIILVSSLLTGGPIAYYLYYYRHPLVLKLHREPVQLLRLTASELRLGNRLLLRTRRLFPLLESARISRDNLEKTLRFYFETASSEERCEILTKQWNASMEPVPHDHLPVFKLTLPDDFLLNMSHFLLVLPPYIESYKKFSRGTGEAFSKGAPGSRRQVPTHFLSEADIVKYLKEIPGIREKVCLIIYPPVTPNSSLRELASGFDNLYVVPEKEEITELLLSSESHRTLARVIASQVKVTRISPYESGGGVTRKNMFFGREPLLAHIIQREPANYLLVGGRQLGKTSLLNALKRRYESDPLFQCDYVCLDSEKLPPVLEDISPATGEKHRMILIDEADKFILWEAKNGYPNLHRFRRLSEEKRCHFILAGFWYLYRSVSLDYQSPVRNFGELIPIEALEHEACRQLAEEPMKSLNIRYESEEMIERILEQTGCRANLVALICNRMLRSLDMRRRELTHDMMEAAFDSDEMRASLGGWVKLTPDEAENRLDRVIVYATIKNNRTFTLRDLLSIMENLGCKAQAEEIKNSLERLVLAFILERKKETYSYRVPLLTRMILDQGVRELLKYELKHF